MAAQTFDAVEEMTQAWRTALDAERLVAETETFLRSRA